MIGWTCRVARCERDWGFNETRAIYDLSRPVRPSWTSSIDIIVRRIQWRYFVTLVKVNFSARFRETGININVDLRAARGRGRVTVARRFWRSCNRSRTPGGPGSAEAEYLNVGISAGRIRTVPFSGEGKNA